MKLSEDKPRAHSSIDNPNEIWLDSKGAWLTYSLLVTFLHLMLLSMPFFETATAWTLTNLIHDVGNYLLLHHVKGAPFETYDQGQSRRLTHWEQIDAGEMLTGTRKFLTFAPIILFILASHYTGYTYSHFVINILALALALIPKFPQFYKVRVFGINKY
ncbi:ORM1-like protein 1 [Hydractinia symbiolongicarpus]|uniref:ORM1-like protein 1 n=1 Tax=Hydractinia symbiolongicarpus TaxID=13093 RepID=UPI00254C4E32|nr:ORM1-like protein 1 [Hydractinia symbiolongicarpus]